MGIVSNNDYIQFIPLLVYDFLLDKYNDLAAEEFLHYCQFLHGQDVLENVYSITNNAAVVCLDIRIKCDLKDGYIIYTQGKMKKVEADWVSSWVKENEEFAHRIVRLPSRSLRPWE